ncbi:MAG: monofunctional biosynthetic peptidoglycan transglycosylase [Rhodobacteraceae bacterium]|nr:monofunctional biosynthetic peptidoglycan transglycosylase [Paracoccaceae bacterium]MAY48189.1 monofunctional biosynthetic peptidoglycan transglycosylase [Paracoccaceae bacterium]
MAKQASKKPGKTRKSKATVTETPLVRRIRPGRWLIRNLIRLALVIAAIFVVLVFLFAVVNPPVTHTMWVEYGRYGPLEREWVPLDDIAPVMARSVVAAEDANFCLHWGLDVDAIKSAMEDGGTRGGSTISQQVSKNVFLWQGRSYVRKAMETMITLMVELVWPKRRILEVYLNVAETGPGIFGVDAAARHYFDVSAADLTPMQAARIAAVLPSPRTRNPANLSPGQRRRAASIADGAATIAVDGRAACFED